MKSGQSKRPSSGNGRRTGTASSPAELEPGDVSALRKLAQELQIHQVELEMQNQALRESQHELEISRDRYANLFDFAPVGYATLDERGSILSVNFTLAALIGTERQQLEGQRFVSLMTFEGRGAFRELFKQASLTRTRHDADSVMRSRKGGNVFVQLVLEPLQQGEGKERFLIGVVDNTEKLFARRASEEAQEKLAEALEASNMIAWSHDLGTGTITMSANAAAVLGIPEGRPYRIHKEMVKDIPDGDGQKYEQALDAAVKGRGSYVTQFRLPGPREGTTRWFEEHGRVVSDGAGNACQIRGVMFEVTERKQAEEAMSLNYQRLASFVTDTVEPVALADGAGVVTGISKAGAALLGYAPDELIGVNGLTLAHPDDARIAETRLAASREEPKGGNIMLRLRRKDGGWGWFDLDVSLVMRGGSENGYMVKLTGVELFTER